MQETAARLLNTAFHRTIRGRCVEAIRQYRLLARGDRVAVCVSGGKDSMLLAVLMRELAEHGETPFHAEFLAMDPGYSPENRRRLEDHAAALGIPLHIFQTDVFRVADKHGKNPCFLCAKMRRGWLYSQAQKLGCHKIALGHHYDDVVETILMAMLYGGQIQTMLPKLHSDHFSGMELIRPLYLVREADIVSWAQANGLSFLDCACAVTARRQADEEQGRRAEVKALIARLCEGNPQIKQNIMNSVKGIQLRKVLGYREGDRCHSFLDGYEDGISVKARDQGNREI